MKRELAEFGRNFCRAVKREPGKTIGGLLLITCFAIVLAPIASGAYISRRLKRQSASNGGDTSCVPEGANISVTGRP